MLTSAQIARSSPLEIIENNEVPVKGESESLTDSQDGKIIHNQPSAFQSHLYEYVDDDDNDDYDYVEEDPEMIERTTGIEIPICTEHADIRYPLQTRYASHPND